MDSNYLASVFGFLGVLVGAAVSFGTELIRTSQNNKLQKKMLKETLKTESREFQRQNLLEIQVELARWESAAIKMLIMVQASVADGAGGREIYLKYRAKLSKSEFILGYLIERVRTDTLRNSLGHYLASHWDFEKQLRSYKDQSGDDAERETDALLHSFSDLGAKNRSLLGQKLRALL